MKKSRTLLFFCLISFLVIYVSELQAIVAMPPRESLRLPSENPHPPITALDKKRVRFAEQAIDLLLRNPLPHSLNSFLPPLPPPQDSPPPLVPNRDLECLQNVSCYSKDSEFVEQIIRFHEKLGEILEIEFVHLIPESLGEFNAEKKKRQAGGFPSMKAREMNAPPPIQPDEYVAHVYVRFTKQTEWEHLDVVMTEDEQGNIFLRRFIGSTSYPMSVIIQC